MCLKEAAGRNEGLAPLPLSAPGEAPSAEKHALISELARKWSVGDDLRNTSSEQIQARETAHSVPLVPVIVILAPPPWASVRAKETCDFIIRYQKNPIVTCRWFYNKSGSLAYDISVKM